MASASSPTPAAAASHSLSIRSVGALAAAVLAAFLIISVAAPAAGALTPEQAVRAHALSLRLKCMCGGCDDTAGTCTHSGGAFAGPCATARAELKEIDQRIERGESDDLILQDFVQEYGPSVLVTPPKRGFDWLVWVMPIALPLLAFMLVWEVVRRWRHRAAVQPAAAAGPPVSDELIARARREAEKESDE